jgi:hypothetical protein
MPLVGTPLGLLCQYPLAAYATAGVAFETQLLALAVYAERLGTDRMLAQALQCSRALRPATASQMHVCRRRSIGR